MFEFLKKPVEKFLEKDVSEKMDENELIAKAMKDITPQEFKLRFSDLYNELEKNFYQNFNLMKLWEPAAEDGIIGKIVPYVIAVLVLINIGVSW